MSILDYLTDIRCPNCNVQLFWALDPVAGEIAFSDSQVALVTVPLDGAVLEARERMEW
jgi:hypothetical protein